MLPSTDLKASAPRINAFSVLNSPAHSYRYLPKANVGKTCAASYERAAVLITSNLPFDEWTETFGTERLTGALLDRLTHHVHILEMNGQSFRLNHSRARNKGSTT